MPHVPNTHVVRDAACRGIGRARANGIVGKEPLLDAAMAEFDRWAADCRYDLDIPGSRAKIESLFRADADIWDAPNPPPDYLPTDLDDLLSFAMQHYGLMTMWYANCERIIRNRSWRIVVEKLRDYGGPWPKAFWLADAIDAAARVAGVSAETLPEGHHC